MKKGNDRSLDRTNLRILERLSREGRMSYSDLAAALGCSINTVRDRIFALERRGVIRGYEATIDEARLGRPVRAMVFLEAAADMRRPAELKEALRLPCVRRAALSTGRHALVLEMVATDVGDLHAQIRSQIYPLGFQNARVVQLGAVPAPAPLATEGVVTTFRRGVATLSAGALR